MKKVLVTGGAGFLGSHLSHALLKRGEKVICLDNFLTGSRSNIKELLQNPHFELIEHDICSPIKLEVDEIYNLACPASPIQYQKNPIKTLLTNLQGSLNMLELARENGATILQASTSEVYGDPEMNPQKESYWGNVNPIGIRACYDEGKRCSETLFFDYARTYGVDIRVVRIFNTYGPRMDPNDGRVVSSFIIQALQNRPLTLFGNGLQTRSFCYVDDLIEGMILFMDQKEWGPMNLGNPNEFTVLALAEMVLKLTHSSSKIEYLPLPSDDPKKRKPDITLAKKLINWEAKIDLEEGLRRTIDSFLGTF